MVLTRYTSERSSGKIDRQKTTHASVLHVLVSPKARWATMLLSSACCNEWFNTIHTVCVVSFECHRPSRPAVVRPLLSKILRPASASVSGKGIAMDVNNCSQDSWTIISGFARKMKLYSVYTSRTYVRTLVGLCAWTASH